jgi:Skp family chaperone for outer membrane proteins
MHRITFMIVMVAILVCGAAANAAGIGLVDYAKASTESNLYKSYDQQGQRYHSELAAEFEEFRSTVLLTSAELTELNALKAKTTPAEADKTRMAELKGFTEKRSQRLRDLQQKPNPTEAETAELTELSRADRAAAEQLQTKDRDLATKFAQRIAEYSNDVSTKVREAVAGVAKEKQLDLVFAKEMTVPDRQGNALTLPILLYGGIDITDDVLAKLNKA